MTRRITVRSGPIPRKITPPASIAIGAGSDSDAIHDNVAAEISAVTEKVSPVDADLVLIEDSSAANAKKRIRLGNIPGGGGAEDFVKNSIGYPVSPGGDDVLWAGSNYATDFTQVTVSGSQTVIEVNGLLSVVFSGQTSGDWNPALKAHTFSIGDSFAVPIQVMINDGSLMSAGIIFTDGTASSSNGIVAHLQHNVNEDFWRTYLRHGTLTAMSTVSTQRNVPHGLGTFWLRLTYQAANSFRKEYSADGFTWSTLGISDESKTMTPTHFGVGWTMDGDSNDGLVSFGPIQKLA